VLNQHHPQVNGQLAEGHCDCSVNLLAQYIDENGIDIAHNNYNTRTIGEKFFEVESAEYKK
jgi:hypothetical protein